MNAAKAISESQRVSGLGRGCGVLFGGVFFAAGAFFMWLMLLQPVIKHFQARSWSDAKSKITLSDVHVNRDSDGDSYRPDIHFEYEAGVQTFTSETYAFSQWATNDRSWARDIVAKYPVGSEHTCFYNPKNPSEAVLNRDLPNWSAFLFGLLPLVFLGVGGWIIYASVAKGRSKPADANDLRLKMNQDESSLADAPWIGNEGPRKLKPEAPRWAAAVFLALFGLVWNGVTWAIAYTVIRDEGLFSFPMLFLSLFIIVGIGIVLGFVYQLMAMFNPVVEVAFSEAAVPIGDSVDIAWELVGNASRLSELKLAVVGCESATYRRGTDTVTDTEDFVRIPIVETSNPDEISFGSTTIQIPAGTMHSFDANNNRVIWRVEVKGVIHRWPDINDTYTFYVKPYPRGGMASQYSVEGVDA